MTPAQLADRRTDRTAAARTRQFRRPRTPPSRRCRPRSPRTDGRARPACSRSSPGIGGGDGEQGRADRRPRSRAPRRHRTISRRGHGAGGPAQPAARGAAHPDRRARTGARGLRSRATPRAAPRSPISAAASTWRWPSACRTSAATARTSSAGCAQILEGRADVRVVGDRFVFQSEVLFDARRRPTISPEGARPNSSAARPTPSCELEKRDPARRQLGAAHRRPHRQAPDQQRRNSPPTGNCRPPAPSRWPSTSSRRASSPNRLVAAGFGEFSRRSTPATPTKPIAATAASSSS